MIKKQELEEAIAELECARDHTPQMCQKLANYYVIRDALFKPKEEETYSYSTASRAASFAPEPIDSYGDSDFMLTIEGKAPAAAWRVIDDLMDTLKAVYPKVYESTMAKMRRIE